MSYYTIEQDALEEPMHSDDHAGTSISNEKGENKENTKSKQIKRDVHPQSSTLQGRHIQVTSHLCQVSWCMWEPGKCLIPLSRITYDVLFI